MKAMNTRLNAREKKRKIITNVKEKYYFAQCPKERTKKKGYNRNKRYNKSRWSKGTQTFIKQGMNSRVDKRVGQWFPHSSKLHLFCNGF